MRRRWGCHPERQQHWLVSLTLLRGALKQVTDGLKSRCNPAPLVLLLLLLRSSLAPHLCLLLLLLLFESIHRAGSLLAADGGTSKNCLLRRHLLRRAISQQCQFGLRTNSETSIAS